MAKRAELGAVVLVMRNSQVVAFDAWGYRDPARQEPLRRDAIFPVGALTKAVTAAAVLALLEQGRLGLDDAVAAHLPEFAAPPPAMTIRHLLSQTAGFAPPQKSATARLADKVELDGFARRIAQLPLASCTRPPRHRPASGQWL